MASKKIVTEENFELILSSVESGNTLKKAIESNKLGDYHHWSKSIRDTEGWQKRYDDARMLGVEVLADEICEISDAPPNLAFGKLAVQKQKLQIDSRKWLLAMIKPRKYSERLQVDHGGQKDNPVIQKIERIIVDSKQSEDNDVSFE